MSTVEALDHFRFAVARAGALQVRIIVVEGTCATSTVVADQVLDIQRVHDLIEQFTCGVGDSVSAAFADLHAIKRRQRCQKSAEIQAGLRPRLPAPCLRSVRPAARARSSPPGRFAFYQGAGW